MAPLRAPRLALDPRSPLAPAFFLAMAGLGFASALAGTPTPAALASLMAALASGTRASWLAATAALAAVLAGPGGEGPGMAAAGVLAGLIFYPAASVMDRYTLCYYLGGGRGRGVLEALLALPLAGIAVASTPGPQGEWARLGAVAATIAAVAVAASSPGEQRAPVAVAVAAALATLPGAAGGGPGAFIFGFTVALLLVMFSLEASRAWVRAVLAPAWIGYASRSLAAWAAAWALAGAPWTPQLLLAAALMAAAVYEARPWELPLESQRVVEVARRACEVLGEGEECVETLVCGPK